MSVTSSQRTVFSVPTDGFAITASDLDDISLNGTRRAWEVPGYADLLGFDQMDGAYDSVFSGDTYTRARSHGVFVRGGGLIPTITGQLGSLLSSGMIGVWIETSTVTPPTASGANKMLWAMMDGTGPSMTHDTCTTGTQRWDLVQVSVAEVNGPTVQRDFQDEVTGAFSSGNPVTYKSISLTFSVKKGVEHASSPGMPAPDTGYKCVYAALIDGTTSTIVKFLDFTVPAGPLKVYTQSAAVAAFYPPNQSWTPSDFPGSLVSGGSSRQLWIMPPFAGCGEARVLGIGLRYNLQSGTVKLWGMNLQTQATRLIMDLTPAVTMDGNDHATVIDLRSRPALSGVNYGPVWGGGSQAKESLGHWATALQIVSGSATDYLNGVEWIVLGG